MSGQKDCGHNHCGACCGGSCGGCGGELALTAGELFLLSQLAQTPFLPVGRRWDQETVVCLDAEGPEAVSGLAQKGLIDVDDRLPLVGFDYRGYENYPVRGSLALTARGQQVLDLLAIQGIEE